MGSSWRWVVSHHARRREPTSSSFGCTPGSQLVDHALVTIARTDRPPGQPFRTAAIGGLAFIGFLTGLVPVIWRAGQETLVVAVAVSGGVFVAMGLVSNAAETALIGVADANQPVAVLALDQLQGRTPVVWTITALVAALSLAIWRTSLVGRWLRVAGLVAAAVFLLGSVFSVLGPTPEGGSSLVGVGLFIVWMLAVSVGLWRTAAPGGV
jgi:hypothetical protein